MKYAAFCSIWFVVRSPSAAERRAHERGSVTAEFAAVMPAVVLVFAACMAGVQVAGQQVRLQDAAADAARVTARGEGAGSAAARAGHLVAGSSLSLSSDGDLICVHLTAPAAPFGPLAGLEIGASSCALGGGR